MTIDGAIGDPVAVEVLASGSDLRVAPKSSRADGTAVAHIVPLNTRFQMLVELSPECLLSIR